MDGSYVLEEGAVSISQFWIPCSTRDDNVVFSLWLERKENGCVVSSCPVCLQVFETYTEYGVTQKVIGHLNFWHKESGRLGTA